MTRWGFGSLALVPLAVLTLLPGCGGLEKPSPAKKAYVFAVSRPAQESPTDVQAILLVRRFRAAPPYEGRAFVYRTGELQYEADFYTEFFAPPAALLADQTRRWLEASRLVRLVAGPGVPAEPTHSLEGRVTALHGDYRQGGAPRAVLGIQVFVSRLGESPEVVFHKDYHREVPADGPSPDALAAAWNRGLHQVLADLEADLRAGPFRPGP